MGIDSLLYSKGDTTILAIRTEWRNGKERRKGNKGSRHGGQERARRDDCKAKQMKNLAGRMQSKAVMPPLQKRQVLQQIKGYNLTYNSDPRGKLSKGLIQRLKFPGKLIHDCSFFHSRSVSGCDEIPKRAILRQQQHDDNDDANTSNDDEKTLLQSCKQQSTTTSDKRIHSLMFTNVTTVASRVEGKVKPVD